MYDGGFLSTYLTDMNVTRTIERKSFSHNKAKKQTRKFWSQLFGLFALNLKLKYLMIWRKFSSNKPGTDIESLHFQILVNIFLFQIHFLIWFLSR
jgi:hypothetical protein